MGVYKNNNGNLELISGATLWADAPIGCIHAYGGATAPNGWLLCHGQAISRTEYAELFAVIGTAYGSGDGSTTFNVPDLRESTIKGAGLTGLSNNHMDADGLQVGEFIDDRMQFHSHNTYLNGIQVSAGGLWATVHDYSETGTHTSNPESPARTGDTTEVKAVGANFIIKAKQVALPADFMDALDDKQDSTDNSLETTDKTVVGAVNELNSNLTKKTTINEESGITFAKTPTYDGRLLLDKMYGMSVQDGTPTPSAPVEIQSAKANFKCVGKNLYDINYWNNDRVNADVTCTIDASKQIIKFDGTASSNAANPGGNGTYNTDKFCKANVGDKLTISFEVISGTATTINNFGIYLNMASGNRSCVSNTKTPSKGTRASYTFTVTQTMLSDDGYLIAGCIQRWMNTGDVYNNLVMAWQIERGDTATDWVPYQSKSITTDLTLRAIEVTSSDGYNLERDGKYYVADTLDWDEDSGYSITRRVGVRENCTITSIASQAILGVVSVNSFNGEDFVLPSNTNVKRPLLMCNRFVTGFFSEMQNNNGYMSYGVVNNRLYLRNDNMTSLEDWQTWATNNPITVYGILATPTTESITSAQAQALLGLKTYDEATYVTQTEDVEGTMVLKYGSSDFATTVLSAYVEGKENELKTSELNNNLADISTDGTIKSVILQDSNIQENLNREVPFVMPEDGYVVARAGAGNNSSTSMLTLIITINNTLRVASLLLEEPYAEAAISSPYIKKGTQVLINVVLTAASWTNETKGIVDFTVI